MKSRILIGRFSPIHKGHQAIIDEMIIDGACNSEKPPIIITGGSNKTDDRHPYTSDEVAHMIHLVYPNVTVHSCPDYENWDEWLDAIQPLIPQNAVIYINNKEQDRLSNFTARGKIYTHAFYNDLWYDLKYETKQVTFPKLFKVDHINATDIRANTLQSYSKLHPKVYEYLCSR